jgi:pimeloyl-ACP methyl ester carboxylesterase
VGRGGKYNNNYLDDVARFMYEHKISMATLGGHGIGGKVALAAACYHYDKVTGYFGLETTPMDQYYH